MFRRRETRGVLPTVFLVRCSEFQETLQFVLHCCDALLLNHPCRMQIVDICETQFGTDQFLKVSGATVRLEVPTVFLGGRWWRESEHAREMSRATSKNSPVNQYQLCHISSCFQRSQVTEHERVFFCTLEENASESHRFQPVWFLH